MEETRSTVSVEEDEFEPKSGRRESNILNDDDFDYAIELVADDEYRFVCSLHYN